MLYSGIHINRGEYFLLNSQSILNQFALQLYKQFSRVMRQLPWKYHNMILSG